MSASGDSKRFRLYLYIVLLLIFIDQAFSIKCYECKSTISNRSEACESGDPILMSDFVVECSDGKVQCLAYYQTIDKRYGKKEQQMTQRMCTSYNGSYGIMGDGCSKSSSPSGTEVGMNCVCGTELCNGTGRRLANNGLLLLGALSVLMRSFYG